MSVFCVCLTEQLTSFQYIDSGKIKKMEKTLNKRIFINFYLFFVFLARFPVPTFLPVERRKILIMPAWNSMHTCASERSQLELNINLGLFINLFQVQCNMEHEWLPEESLEGTLANLFLRSTKVLIEYKHHGYNEILKS